MSQSTKSQQPQPSDMSEAPSPQIENPTQKELKASLEKAEFPTAAHMAAEIFGVRSTDD